MAKKLKITCDYIEYNIETSKDLTILELALEMTLMPHIHVKAVFVVLVLHELLKVLLQWMIIKY